MTDPTDLIAWLRAQIDDDEAYARNAFGDHNDAGPNWHEEWSGALNIGDTEDLILTNDSQVSRYMARFDPARMLAEVDAKRAHIARWEHVTALLADAENPSAIRNELLSVRRAYALVIADDAVPYAARPGYQPEWRP